MRIEVLTLFPEIYRSLDVGIIGKALKKNAFEVNVTNIRDYSLDKHKRCDDYPYGGGPGMLMTPQPLHDAISAVDPDRRCVRIYLSPKGVTLNQNLVRELSSKENIMLINGFYEGIDQRIIDLDVDMELSIGDYVLTGGELPAMVVTDCLARYVEGVINTSSLVQESFSENALEYPQYTRPVEYRGLTVPDVLRSGNHAEIDKWRREQSEKITREKRPDLLSPKDGGAF